MSATTTAVASAAVATDGARAIAGASPPRGRIARAFSSEGRCGVLAYNARILFAVTPIVLFAIIAGVMSASMDVEEGSGDAQFTLLMVLMAAGLLIALPLIVFTTVKRLHDLNLSAWYLLVNFIPVVGTVFGLVIALMPGKDDDNRYGLRKPPTGLEKVIGIVFIVLMLLFVAAALLGIGVDYSSR